MATEPIAVTDAMLELELASSSARHHSSWVPVLARKQQRGTAARLTWRRLRVV
jgi:hypothetical protein